MLAYVGNDEIFDSYILRIAQKNGRTRLGIGQASSVSGILNDARSSAVHRDPAIAIQINGAVQSPVGSVGKGGSRFELDGDGAAARAAPQHVQERVTWSPVGESSAEMDGSPWADLAGVCAPGRRTVEPGGSFRVGAINSVARAQSRLGDVNVRSVCSMSMNQR